MPAIKISHVVSFSSEDAVHRAENLLAPSKKWRSGSAGEKQVSAVLQLERASLISSIDIGNDGSAFVEVLVGRRESGGGGGERDYTTLLAASSFMTPIESRNEEMSSRVRIFSADKLSAEAREEKWDRVKVVCTQPFNSRVKYGLSFLKLNEKDLEGTQEQKKATTSLGAFKLREEKKETGLGSWFAKKKNSEDSGMTTKAAAVVASPAAELRSERTLAAMALKESGTSPKKRDKMMAQFRPDNNGNKRKAPPAAAAGQGSTKNKLPRRDGVPGDSPPPPKKRDKKGSPSPSPSTPARRRPFLEAATPSSSSSSSAKKKVPKQQQQPRVARRPFARLLDGVVFTLSGYQNPLRGQLRQKATDMGAKYRGDWDGSCTHLVCAFTNTPKFNQVKGKGKIVKKEWVERCHSERKRLPWRRFCLDNVDKKAESEEEIWEEEVGTTSSSSAAAQDEDMDTDDEIEAVRRMEKEEEEEERRKRRNLSPEKSKSAATDDDELDSDEAYNAETDVDDDGDDEDDFPPLPDFFAGRVFVLFVADSGLRKNLRRRVVAAGGAASDYMRPDADVAIVPDGKGWNGDMEEAAADNPSLRFVNPGYVRACWKARKMLPWREFSVDRR